MPNQSQQKDFRLTTSISDAADDEEGEGISIRLDEWDEWFDISM